MFLWAASGLLSFPVSLPSPWLFVNSCVLQLQLLIHEVEFVLCFKVEKTLAVQEKERNANGGDKEEIQ